jgi:endonuclease YncB( thermonuclease family)
MINSWPATTVVRDRNSLRHLWMSNRLGTKVDIANTVSALVIAAIMVIAAPAVRAQHSIVGTASIIDGDTIEVHGARIRMHGIDAPESRQECIREDGTSWRCGQQAALALSDRIGRATVRCEPRDRDRYGRVVAVCFKVAEDLDRWMVTTGWAVAYRKYSLDYVADEERAKRAKLGIWSGSFEMPWDWRARGTKH